MKIIGQRNYLMSLESIAMTDIVLNMFIFFFISFSLLYTFNPRRMQKLEVKLPEAKNITPIESTNQADITLTNEGLIYLDQDLVTVKELKEKMYLRRKNNPRLTVVLVADKLVRFKHMVSILDTLSGLGITNVNIAAVQE